MEGARGGVEIGPRPRVCLSLPSFQQEAAGVGLRPRRTTRARDRDLGAMTAACGEVSRMPRAEPGTELRPSFIFGFG